MFCETNVNYILFNIFSMIVKNLLEVINFGGIYLSFNDYLSWFKY